MWQFALHSPVYLLGYLRVSSSTNNKNVCNIFFFASRQSRIVTTGVVSALSANLTSIVSDNFFRGRSRLLEVHFRLAFSWNNFRCDGQDSRWWSWQVATTRRTVTIRHEASHLLRPVTDPVYWTWMPCYYWEKGYLLWRGANTRNVSLAFINFKSINSSVRRPSTKGSFVTLNQILINHKLKLAREMLIWNSRISMCCKMICL